MPPETHIGDVDISFLLGVDINFMLSFNDQITKLYRKAAIQLNVLLPLSKFLNTENIIIYSFISLLLDQILTIVLLFGTFVVRLTRINLKNFGIGL